MASSQNRLNLGQFNMPSAHSSSSVGEWVAPDGGWGWMVLLASCLINMTVPGFVKVYGMFMTTIGDDFNVSYTTVSWIAAICYFMYNFMGLLTGVLARNYSHRAVVLTGCCLALLGVFIAYCAASIFHLYLGLGILVGCGSCFIYCSSILAVSEYFERRRGLATGLSVGGCALGSMLYPPLISHYLEQHGFRFTMLLVFLLMVAATLCSLLYQPVGRHRRWVRFDAISHSGLLSQLMTPVDSLASVTPAAAATAAAAQDTIVFPVTQQQQQHAANCLFTPVCHHQQQHQHNQQQQHQHNQQQQHQHNQQQQHQHNQQQQHQHNQQQQHQHNQQQHQHNQQQHQHNQHQQQQHNQHWNDNTGNVMTESTDEPPVVSSPPVAAAAAAAVYGTDVADVPAAAADGGGGGARGTTPSHQQMAALTTVPVLADVIQTAALPPVLVTSLVPEVLPATPTGPDQEDLDLAAAVAPSRTDAPPTPLVPTVCPVLAEKSKCHLSTIVVDDNSFKWAETVPDSQGAVTTPHCFHCPVKHDHNTAATSNLCTDPFSPDYCEVCHTDSFVSCCSSDTAVPHTLPGDHDDNDGGATSRHKAETVSISPLMTGMYPLGADLAPSMVSFVSRAVTPVASLHTETAVKPATATAAATAEPFIDLSLFSNPVFMAITVSGALFQISAANLLLLLPSLAVDLGVTRRGAALALSLFSVSDLTGRVLVAACSDHTPVPSHTFLLASYILAGVATASLTLFSPLEPIRVGVASFAMDISTLIVGAPSSSVGVASSSVGVASASVGVANVSMGVTRAPFTLPTTVGLSGMLAVFAGLAVSAIGLAVGVASAMTSVVLIERLGTETLAQSFGLSVCVTGVALLLAPPLIGLIRQLDRSPAPVLVLLAILPFLAAAYLSMIPANPSPATQRRSTRHSSRRCTAN